MNAARPAILLEYHRGDFGTGGLAAQGVRLLKDLRTRFDQRVVLVQKILWAIVDASFCNRTVFRGLPARTVLIGRTRKDIRLYAEPTKKTKKGKGRKNRYGKPLPTPEQFRQDMPSALPRNRLSVVADQKTLSESAT